MALYEANRDRLPWWTSPLPSLVRSVRPPAGACLGDPWQAGFITLAGQTKARWVTARWTRALCGRDYRVRWARTWWLFDPGGQVWTLDGAGRWAPRRVRRRTRVLGAAYHALNWCPWLRARGAAVYLVLERR